MLNKLKGVKMGNQDTFKISEEKLEFRVEGIDHLVHYGDLVSFWEVTEDWHEAIKWMKKLAENNPEKAKCVVIKVITIEGDDKPLKQEVMEFTAKNFNAERACEVAVSSIRILELNLEAARLMKERAEKERIELIALRRKLSELGLILS